MNRKLLSVILALVMVLGVFTPVFAEEAKTETTEAPAAPAVQKHIEFLQTQGIIKGDNSGDLMLEKNIDRASFAAILVRAAGKEATAESVKSLPGRFKDMTAAHWANGYATVAHDNNLMKGNPAGEFMPGKEISYAEIATTLVRFLGKEKTGFVYPTSYIAAASELGLFEGVENIQGKYNNNAVRNDVFKMLYNALSKEDFGRYNVYKVIFLENDRVAQLGADELNAEVLSVVQVANKVSERGTAKIGTKFVLNVKGVKVEGGLADTENLLGKVADITLDENNKLVKVVVDTKNYEYLHGGFTASKDGKTFKLGRLFNVRFDERYFDWKEGEYPRQRTSERDDRVYRTYVTAGSRADNYNYFRFAERLNLEENHKDKIKANFARITVKDGMVLFVDAYELSDIAPVKGGGGVYYWNDVRDGAVERMTPARRVIGYTEKEGFKKISADDIKADDTIHWMDGFTLVRQDAKIEAKLVNTYRDSDGEWIVLKGADEKETKYYLNSYVSQVKPYNSVYAYDDQHYRTTKDRGLIDAMVGSDVKVLIDIRNGVQLITSHEKFTDRLGLLNKVSSANGTEFYAANAPEEAMYRLGDGWDSNYYKNGIWNAQKGLHLSTQENKWAEFNRLDLAYTTADKEGKAKVVAVIDGFEYNGEYFVNPYRLDRAPGVNTWRTARFINSRRNFVRVGTTDYRYTDDTEVFVINEAKDRFDKTSRTHVVTGVTLEDVKKYNANNLNLQAVVLTEANYARFLKDIKVNTYGRYDSTRDDFAKAIIFTNYDGPQTKFGDPELGRVTKVDRWAETAEVEVNPGQYETFKINGGDLDMTTAVIGKFVQFRRAKDSDPVAARFDKVIEGVKGTIEAYDHHIMLNGITKINVDKLTKVFGDSRDGYGMVYANGGYADLIVYERKDGSKSNLTVLDQFAANAFVLTVNGLRNASTNEDIVNAIKEYTALSDAAKATDAVKAAKKTLDRWVDIKLNKDFSAEYKLTLAQVVNITSKSDAEAKKVISSNITAAEELLAKYKAFNGLNLGSETYDQGVETRFNGLISDVKREAEADKVAKLSQEYGKYETRVKAEIANKFMILGQDIPSAKQTETEYTNAQTVADRISSFTKTVTATTEAAAKTEIQGFKDDLQKLVNAYDAADGLARKNLQ